MTTRAFSAFVLGVAVGLVFPWLWREFLQPKVD